MSDSIKVTNSPLTIFYQHDDKLNYIINGGTDDEIKFQRNELNSLYFSSRTNLLSSKERKLNERNDNDEHFKELVNETLDVFRHKTN